MSWGTDRLTVRFGRLEAVAGVTVDIPDGAVTGVVGGDGAGKTTLLRALAGAVPTADGRIRRPPAAALGYMSARSGTYPDLSVAENLAFTGTTYGLSPRDVRRQADRYLERTGLAAFRDRLAGQLSGGMRQKLGVIQAMLHRPRLLLLDEPTTGVDPVSRADLWWLIGRAAAEGAAVAFATTYLDEAERATQVLVLEDGQPLATGTPDDIVAAMPGTIRPLQGPPPEETAWRSWRRRAAWRVWDPGDGPEATLPAGATAATAAEPSSDEVVDADLQDAVIVLALARERQNPGAGDGRGRS